MSNKEDSIPLDEMQNHYMKFLQKQTIWDSFNNEEIKSRNKLNVDLKSINVLVLKKSNKELKD